MLSDREGLGRTLEDTKKGNPRNFQKPFMTDDMLGKPRTETKLLLRSYEGKITE